MSFKTLIVTLAILFAPCLQTQTQAGAALVDCNAVEICHGDVRIQVLPELELFQILCQLSGTYRGLTTLDFQYKSDIETGFKKYRDHPAVSVLRRIIGRHPAHNCIKAYILNDEYENDLDNLKLLQLENTEAKLQAVAELRAACRQFAEDTGFVTFFDNHRPYYEAKVQAVKTALTGLDLITSREAFWGINKDHYRIVVALLESDIHSCWFTNNDQLHSLFLLTPKFVINGDAVFGNAETSDPSQGKIAARDYIYYGSGHEFGHSVINLLTPKHKTQIEALPLPYKKCGQLTKVDFLNESILRTFTAYEFIQKGLEDVAHMMVQAEAMNGYVYNEQLLTLLQEYNQNRERYPSFKDYLPHLLSELRK